MLEVYADPQALASPCKILRSRGTAMRLCATLNTNSTVFIPHGVITVVTAAHFIIAGLKSFTFSSAISPEIGIHLAIVLNALSVVIDIRAFRFKLIRLFQI